MQSFVHGLPSSSSSLLLLLAIRCFLVLSLLIAYGQSDSVESSTDPLALLRGTFKFWRRIYDTYQQEMSLGYCWADYLLGLKDFESLLSFPHFFQDDFTTTEWRYDSMNPRHSSRGNHSRIVARSDHNNRENPSNLEKIARRDLQEEYAFPRMNFRNDSFVPSNFSYEAKQPMDLTRFVLEENSRLKRLRRGIDRESTFLAVSAGKLSSSLGRQNLPTTHRFFFRGRNRAKRRIEAYARNIFPREEEPRMEVDLKYSTFLAGRKVFDAKKIRDYVEKYFGGDSGSRESKGVKNVSDGEEEESEEKYDRRVKEGRNDDYSSGIESQGRRSSSEKLVTRGRSVKRILSTLPEHPIFIAFLRTLTILVRVGRLIMDIVDSSKVLSCTRDYLWSKAIEWIDA